MADGNPDPTIVDLERNEVALIIGEEEGVMSVRVVSATDIAEDAPVIPRPQEITLALAMRLLKDPDFHDDVLDWYDEHQDDPDEDDPED